MVVGWVNFNIFYKKTWTKLLNPRNCFETQIIYGTKRTTASKYFIICL